MLIILRNSMKSLNLSGVNLSVSSSHLLARAGASLSTLNLTQCLLTSFQCEDLFDQITELKPSLELVLDKIDLSRVDSKKLGKSVIYFRCRHEKGIILLYRKIDI